MSDLSSILSLPLLQPAVASRTTATPPAFPSAEQRFILPPAPTSA